MCNAFPHITFGTIETDNALSACRVIDDISHQFAPIQLERGELFLTHSSQKKVAVHFDDTSGNLSRYQTAVFDKLTDEGGARIVGRPTYAVKRTPHVTYSRPEAEPPEVPQSLLVDRIAVASVLEFGVVHHRNKLIHIANLDASDPLLGLEHVGI